MAEEHFSEKDQAQIVEAIQLAEKETSGEIRVHIEAHATIDPIERAKQVFFELGMHNTAQKNAVLIYVAFDDHKLAIIGDSGIHEKVGDNFWQSEKDLMVSHFKKNEYALGLSLAIEQVGEKLKAYFPYLSQDKNELSDTISFGGKHEK
ncbi:MAG: TPM domain-containing protein [Bacteroidia bacterium]|nr:TPM domain-containing protein [Bacteroidia bacterium]